jgi:beta-glucosidase/6-phospho-beta-glucosidase/beta-galactosidase
MLRLSEGTLDGGINNKGIEYYNKLIDLLLENGKKTPFFDWQLN